MRFAIAFLAALALACGGDGATVASNDDSVATTTDAFVSYPVTQTAVYVVSLSSADPAATGAYTIAVGGFPIGPSGPRPVAAPGTIRAGQSFAMPRLPRKR